MAVTEPSPNDVAAPVSWGAILAGAFVAAALTVIFLALGTGTGLAMVSPWSGSGVSATTFKITTGAYALLTAIISSAIGGYVAGRLRAQWTVAAPEEVLFRDTAHGLAAWAFATMLGFATLGAASTWISGHVVGGFSQGLGQGTTQTNSLDYFVDTLLRPASTVQQPGAQGGRNAQEDASTRRELNLILIRGLAVGAELPPADRTYLSQVVASRAGISQQEADTRVNNVLAKAKEFLDAVRKNTIAIAMWLTVALFAGAFAASAAAIEGGQLRDGRWRGVVFARNSRATR
jgi:hypothetical protein